MYLNLSNFLHDLIIPGFIGTIQVLPRLASFITLLKHVIIIIIIIIINKSTSN